MNAVEAVRSKEEFESFAHHQQHDVHINATKVSTKVSSSLTMSWQINRANPSVASKLISKMAWLSVILASSLIVLVSCFFMQWHNGLPLLTKHFGASHISL
jgi:hypothetical protein